MYKTCGKCGHLPQVGICRVSTMFMPSSYARRQISPRAPIVALSQTERQRVCGIGTLLFLASLPCSKAAEENVANLRQVDVLLSQGRSVGEAVRSIGVTQFDGHASLPQGHAGRGLMAQSHRRRAGCHERGSELRRSPCGALRGRINVLNMKEFCRISDLTLGQLSNLFQ
jgi:hypothetical protein